MKALLITVAVLILLVVGADIGGRALAESRAGEAIASEAKMATAPDVTIHGFSFLAQAFPGHYGKVTLASADLSLGPVSNVASVLDLYDVDFPMSDALSGNTSRLTAQRAQLRAEIPIQSLTALVSVQGLTLSQGNNGSIRLATTVTVAGRQVPVSTDLTVSFSAGQLHLAAGQVSGAGVTVSDPALTKALSMNIPLANLPVPITAASVTVQGSILVLNAQATQISAANLH